MQREMKPIRNEDEMLGFPRNLNYSYRNLFETEMMPFVKPKINEVSGNLNLGLQKKWRHLALFHELVY